MDYIAKRFIIRENAVETVTGLERGGVFVYKEEVPDSPFFETRAAALRVLMTEQYARITGLERDLLLARGILDALRYEATRAE